MTATGWDVDELVRGASNVYLEMVFRDGIYHADPHPGNFLLPDGQRLAILDFGDVGRLTGPRKAQLEALLLAVGSRDADELTDIVIDLTHAPADLDADKLNGQIGTWLNRYLGGSIADLDMVGATNAGMQIMHSNPADLSRRPRAAASSPGSSLGSGVFPSLFVGAGNGSGSSGCDGGRLGEFGDATIIHDVAAEPDTHNARDIAERLTAVLRQTGYQSKGIMQR